MRALISAPKSLSKLASFMLLMFALLLAGCDSTEKGNYKPYKFTLKILSIHGEDISPAMDVGNIRMLVFDSAGTLIDLMSPKMTDVASGREYTYYYENEGRITVVCLGNTSGNVTISDLELGDPITKLIITPNGNGNANLSTPFFYYGLNEVMPGEETATVVGLTVTMGAVQIRTNSPESEDVYTCRITTEHSSLDYRGEMTGKPAQYELPLSYSSHYGIWESQEYSFLSGELSEVTLYKNGEVYRHFPDAEPALVNPGGTTLILFDIFEE